MKKTFSFLILVTLLVTTAVSCDSSQDTDTVEEVIISSIEEGLFYFPENLDEHELMRKEVITFFNERLNILYTHSISFQSQLNQLNETIILAETDLVVADYEQLIKNQLAYQAKTNALIESINTYYKIAEENIDEENLFKRKAMDDLIELINLQEEYLSFSIGSLEVIGTGMKEENSIAFLDSTVTFFNESLNKSYIDLVTELAFVSDLYQKIISADYYVNVPRLLSYLNTIEDLDTKETIVKPLLDQKSKPDILIPINDQSLNRKHKPFSFFKIAYAANNLDEEVYKSFGYSLIFEIVNLKDSLDDVDQDYEFKSTYNDVIAQSFVNIISNIDANKIRKNYQDQLNNQLRNQLYRQPDSMRSDTEKMKVVNHFKALASKSYSRQKIIENITKAQSLGGFMVMMNSDNKFNVITNALESYITSKESVNYNKLKNLSDTFKEKLVTLLGDQQEIFAEKLLSIEAEKIADFYITWQEKNKSLSIINISEQDIISFINTLGIDLKQPSQQAVIDDYSGVYTIHLSITESSFIEQEYRPDPIVPDYSIDDWNESVANEINTWDPETSQMELKDFQSKINIQHNVEENTISFKFFSDLTSFFSSHNSYRQFESSFEGNKLIINSTGGSREENETELSLIFDLNEEGIPSFTGTLKDYKALYYTYFKRSYNIKGIKTENLETKE